MCTLGELMLKTYSNMCTVLVLEARRLNVGLYWAAWAPLNNEETALSKWSRYGANINTLHKRTYIFFSSISVHIKLIKSNICHENYIILKCLPIYSFDACHQLTLLNIWNVIRQKPVQFVHPHMFCTHLPLYLASITINPIDIRQ